jgi:hypothetical protein
MRHKVFRSVFTIAVAIGISAVVVRLKDAPAPAMQHPKDQRENALARPMACYRVYEDPVSGGMDYRGANFKGRVSEDGCSFGAVPSKGAIWAAREFNVEFGAPRLQQGSMKLECDKGRFDRTGFGVARLDRGAVIEEYVCENRRVEQLFRIPMPLSSGDLRVSIPVKCDLTGPVVEHEPGAEGWKEVQFQKGGLAFCDASGATRLAYHSAVAIDAAGHEVALAPKYSGGQIVLEVPALFMDAATYPVVIDPWLDFAGSGSGGGVSQNGSTSENPVVVLQGAQPFIAWADNTAANTKRFTDIYMKWWNGFTFEDLGGSSVAGGISKGTQGTAANPTIAFTPRGALEVAWEDDQDGNVGVFLKSWPVKGSTGSGSWTELAGSASSGGLFSTFTPCQHPSVAGVRGIIPGTVTTDPNTGITSSTPAIEVDCPVIAFDNPFQGNHQIYCLVFYPGAPPQPVSNVFPTGLPATNAGWYPMTLPDGQFVDGNTIPPVTVSNTPSGHEAQYPSVTVDDDNRVAIAWQDSSNGVYEIFFKNFTFNAPPADNRFRVTPNPANPSTENDLSPAGNFTAIAGSASGGGISNKGTLAQYPSLTVDQFGLPFGSENFTVAWQQSEGAGNPATSTQIYVARSVNGAAFAGIGGSTGAGGISHTLAHAVTPSADSKGGYIGVAWADDSNGRSSIYLRRFFLGVGGSGLWDQVGFQGSAFPAQGLETNAPIEGISQSLNFSIQPKVKLDAFGNPTVVWADGTAATFDILAKVFSPNGPGIATGVGTPNPVFSTALRQTLTDPSLGPATDVTVGGFAGSNTNVFLSSAVFTETLTPPGTSLLLEVEVQPQGSPFTNTANFQSLYVAPNDPTNTVPALTNLAVFQFSGIPNANYHWQARTSDRLGRVSPWIQFAVDPGGVSFRINAANAGGGGGGSNGPANTGATSNNAPTRSKCGLTGLEGVALLAALRLLRRKRVS